MTKPNRYGCSLTEPTARAECSRHRRSAPVQVFYASPSGGSVFTLRRGVAVAAAVLLALSAAACESSDNSSDSGSSSDSAKIALLLPESQTTRYEQFDKPLFEAKVKSLCSGCSVIYNNANQQSDTQQQQAEAALNDG